MKLKDLSAVELENVGAVLKTKSLEEAKAYLATLGLDNCDDEIVVVDQLRNGKEIFEVAKEANPCIIFGDDNSK